MLAILAAILFAVGYILQASAAHVSAWLAPGALTPAGLCCLALHLAGVGTWTRKQ